jgi:hypothetical protein
MDLANITSSSGDRPKDLDGKSLLPFFFPETHNDVGENRSTSNDIDIITSTTDDCSTICTGNTSQSTTNHKHRVIDRYSNDQIQYRYYDGRRRRRRRSFVVNQFHGADIAMSWFSIIGFGGQYKYNVFGTGEQHPPQLFDLFADPDEFNNLMKTTTTAAINQNQHKNTTAIDNRKLTTERTGLSDSKYYKSVADRLDALLLTVVNYTSVAIDVAQYVHKSLRYFINATGEDWKTVIRGLRWEPSINYDFDGSIKAIEEYIAGPAVIHDCRSEGVWPKLREKVGHSK